MNILGTIFLAKAHHSASIFDTIIFLIIALFFISSFAYTAIPKLINAYRTRRERNRWAEIVQYIPELPQPRLPTFQESDYTIRGMKYNSWLDEFRSWSHANYNFSCRGSRITKGKQYATEDRKWHSFFEEWRATFLEPELEEINRLRKQESNLRRIQLREEYKQRFGSRPKEDEIPERFIPISGQTCIENCYVNRTYRNIRNHRV